jgi:hypothetical protein
MEDLLIPELQAVLEVQLQLQAPMAAAVVAVMVVIPITKLHILALRAAMALKTQLLPGVQLVLAVVAAAAEAQTTLGLLAARVLPVAYMVAAVVVVVLA